MSKAWDDEATSIARGCVMPRGWRIRLIMIAAIGVALGVGVASLFKG